MRDLRKRGKQALDYFEREEREKENKPDAWSVREILNEFLFIS